jgi:hypothetical protein
LIERSRERLLKLLRNSHWLFLFAFWVSGFGAVRFWERVSVGRDESVDWYNYLAALFAGLFLGNAVPHFVQGVCGNPFPTPFAKPPGKGLSSPTVNVVWALVNIVVGYILFRVGQVGSGNYFAVGAFLLGVAAIAVLSSVVFQKKERG